MKSGKASTVKISKASDNIEFSASHEERHQEYCESCNFQSDMNLENDKNLENFIAAMITWHPCINKYNK